MKPTPPNPDDIYSLIGFTLCYVQSVEQHLRFCTTYILQGDSPLNWERLQHLQASERKKALGYFVAQIKSRTELLPAFEDLVDSFLQNRNDLVHNQHLIPGWDLHTEAGLDVARRYVVNLCRQGGKISEILAALTLRWQEQVGIVVPTTPESQAFFDEIDKKYGALVDTIFTAKERLP